MYIKSFCIFFVFFSFSVGAVEISNDLFIESDSDSMEAEDVMSLSDSVAEPPKVQKTQKKMRVVIKRNVSALDEAVGDLKKTRKLATEKKEVEAEEEETLSDRPSKRKVQSLDYGDYEIQWEDRE